MSRTWTNGGPAAMATRLAALVDQVQPMIEEIATDEASRGQTAMQDRASWVDRTGQARGGLFGDAEPTAGGAVIRLGGTVDYQPYLETGTRYMRAYPIIRPVADEIEVEAIEQVSRALRELFA